jgi:hypothetical protein
MEDGLLETVCEEDGAIQKVHKSVIYVDSQSERSPGHSIGKSRERPP